MTPAPCLEVATVRFLSFTSKCTAILSPSLGSGPFPTVISKYFIPVPLGASSSRYWSASTFVRFLNLLISFLKPGGDRAWASLGIHNASEEEDAPMESIESTSLLRWLIVSSSLSLSLLSVSESTMKVRVSREHDTATPPLCLVARNPWDATARGALVPGTVLVYIVDAGSLLVLLRRGARRPLSLSGSLLSPSLSANPIQKRSLSDQISVTDERTGHMWL